MFGRGIHDKWYQWFAGAEDKYCKKNPWRQISFFSVFMDMKMFIMMSMFMHMHTPCAVKMNMLMRLITNGVSYSPNEIHQAECCKYP